MSEFTRQQGFEILCMFASGMGFLMWYQILSYLKILFLTKRALLFFGEIVNWCILSWYAGEMLYYFAYGILSVHVVVSFFLGIIVWKCLFYKSLCVTMVRELR